MFKEIFIFVFAFLALCQCLPIEEPKSEALELPPGVPQEKAAIVDEPVEEGDLSPDASAWGGYGRGYGWGGHYNGGGWGRGWGGWGNRGYGGWGHGHRYGGWGGYWG